MGNLKFGMKRNRKKIPVASAVAYAWYVWEKGYQGDTVVKWIN